MTRRIELNKKDYKRCEELLKAFGTKIQHDVHWHLTSFLSEIPYPYMRVFNKENEVIAVVSQEIK